MLSLRVPSSKKLETMLRRQRDQSHSYAELECSRATQAVNGLVFDQLRVRLGSGEDAFVSAKRAINGWQMFPEWTQVRPEHKSIEAGYTVITCVHALGLWWSNPARIVYVIDEPTRYGFAYGTLPEHLEMGEELFMVEQDSSGRVHYELRAFSRPRWLPARLGYPVVRGLQGRFRRDSARRMQEYVRAQ